MSKFLTGEALGNLIYDIIWDAESRLLIVSPYIKLDDYFKKLFEKHKSNPNLNILLVFGKNENSVNKSLNKSDFEFFKKFPNVSIVYVPNLHAKYYANELNGVITSINLYDYSFKNNIEYGVFAEQTMFGKISNSTNVDTAAWQMSMEIAASNEPVFIKRPVFEYKKSILSKSKNYIESRVLLDSTDSFYGNYKSVKSIQKSVFDYPEELDLAQEYNARPEREDLEEVTFGFCIRTGVKIPFNPEKPFTYNAYLSWANYENIDFEEKYCHFSGEPSFGKTSMAKPILRKNWSKAQKVLNGYN